MRSCASCRFWEGEAGEGICRRRAPVVTGGMMSNVETVWPRTTIMDWCGDGQPRFQERGSVCSTEG